LSDTLVDARAQAEKNERPQPFGTNTRQRLEMREKLIDNINDALTQARYQFSETLSGGSETQFQAKQAKAEGYGPES